MLLALPGLRALRSVQPSATSIGTGSSVGAAPPARPDPPTGYRQGLPYVYCEKVFLQVLVSELPYP